MKKFAHYFISIFSLDLITKLLANFLLPYEKDVFIFGNDFSFYLIYNLSASGSKIQKISHQFSNPNVLLFNGACFGLVSGLTLYFTRNYPFKLWQRILIILLFIVVYYIVQFSLPNLLSIKFSNYFISWFGKLCAITLIFGLYSITKDYWLKAILISILACGFGNFINHFYPPFVVIDFISAPILTKIFNLQICNFADIVFSICLILFGLRLFYLLWLKIYFRVTQYHKN